MGGGQIRGRLAAPGAGASTRVQGHFAHPSFGRKLPDSEPSSFPPLVIELDLGDGVTARSLRTADAPAVHALLAANRATLDRWLRWSSGIQTLADAEALVATFREKEALGDGFHLGIWEGRDLLGGAVCWYVHPQNWNAEVGTWLAAEATGRGLATRAAQAVVRHLFSERRLHRVEMQCGAENDASRAVAERCGFTLEGVRRESHWVTDRFVDHAVYGVLDREWSAREQAG